MSEPKRDRSRRVPMGEQPPEQRIHNFAEVPLGYTPEDARSEAERCLKCKKPKCVEGCPVRVDIPGFIALVAEGKFVEAAQKIKETNCLPAVCGRVCPQETQCETLCVLGRKCDPIAVGRLERFVADFEREHGAVELPRKAPPTGRRVAVVGAGPAGLTVAGDLICLGHEVCIFEAFHQPGGVLVYGIPEFRLPKAIVAAEVAYLQRLGVTIDVNQVIGKSITVDELLGEEGFDAVFVGVGAGLPQVMGIPGENLGGVYLANEYLTRVNLMRAYAFPRYDTPVVRGNDVCVVGGGNVAMDAAPRPGGLAPSTSTSSIAARAKKCPPGRKKSTMPGKRGSFSDCSVHRPSIWATKRAGSGRSVARKWSLRAGRFRATSSRAQGRLHLYDRCRHGHHRHRRQRQSLANAEHQQPDTEPARLHRRRSERPHHAARRVGRRRHRHRQRHRHPCHGRRTDVG